MNNKSIEFDPANIPQNKLLTVQEVAVYLRISRVTAWRWCQQGTIPAFRIGRNWRIHQNDLLAFVDCLKNDNDQQAPPMEAES